MIYCIGHYIGTAHHRRVLQNEVDVFTGLWDLSMPCNVHYKWCFGNVLCVISKRATIEQYSRLHQKSYSVHCQWHFGNVLCVISKRATIEQQSRPIHELLSPQYALQHLTNKYLSSNCKQIPRCRKSYETCIIVTYGIKIPPIASIFYTKGINIYHGFLHHDLPRSGSWSSQFSYLEFGDKLHCSIRVTYKNPDINYKWQTHTLILNSKWVFFDRLVSPISRAFG